MAIKGATAAALLALASLPWLGSGQEPAEVHRPGEHRILFQARDGQIFIPAQVNGKQVTLLLDTGAVLTTFSLKIAPATNTDSRITMDMAKGSITAYLGPRGFTLGEPDQKERHCSFRQNVVVGDFKFGAADGVIGLDVLSSFKSATFDFKNSVLILEDK